MILFCGNNHKNIWTLGGIFKFQTAGKKIVVTPLKLTKAYIDFEKYKLFVSYDQIS
jgi:hypothetical protein